MYKVIDLITGEIIESKFENMVIKDAHNRMADYRKMYKKDYYLQYKGNNTWELKEYVIGYRGQYKEVNNK